MGGRLSMPRGPDGVSELSKPTSGFASARRSRRGIVNGRTIMAPLAAVVMAGLLFVYSRTAIHAAKLNAKKHREADGGQISWHNETLRRHGQRQRVEDDRSTVKEAFMADVSRAKKAPGVVKEAKARTERSAEEKQLRKSMGKDD